MEFETLLNNYYLGFGCLSKKRLTYSTVKLDLIIWENSN